MAEMIINSSYAGHEIVLNKTVTEGICTEYYYSIIDNTALNTNHTTWNFYIPKDYGSQCVFENEKVEGVAGLSNISQITQDYANYRYAMTLNANGSDQFFHYRFKFTLPGSSMKVVYLDYYHNEDHSYGWNNDILVAIPTSTRGSYSVATSTGETNKDNTICNCGTASDNSANYLLTVEPKYGVSGGYVDIKAATGSIIYRRVWIHHISGVDVYYAGDSATDTTAQRWTKRFPLSSLKYDPQSISYGTYEGKFTAQYITAGQIKTSNGQRVNFIFEPIISDMDETRGTFNKSSISFIRDKVGLYGVALDSSSMKTIADSNANNVYELYTSCVGANASGDSGMTYDIEIGVLMNANKLNDIYAPDRTQGDVIRLTVNMDAYKTKQTNLWDIDDNECTVTLRGIYAGTLSGGEGWTINAEGSQATKVVTKGSKVGTLPTWTRSGYTFTKWSNTSTGSELTSESVVNDNVIAQASYIQKKTFTITYSASGATNVPSQGSVEEGSNYIISSNIPTKAGYNFVSWKGSNSSSYNPNGTISNVTSNITLTAQWSINAYSVNIAKGTGIDAVFVKKGDEANYTRYPSGYSATVAHGTSIEYSGEASEGYDNASSDVLTVTSNLNRTVTATKKKFTLTPKKNAGISALYYKKGTNGIKTPFTIAIQAECKDVYYFSCDAAAGYTKASSADVSETITSNYTYSPTATLNSHNITVNLPSTGEVTLTGGDRTFNYSSNAQVKSLGTLSYDSNYYDVKVESIDTSITVDGTNININAGYDKDITLYVTVSDKHAGDDIFDVSVTLGAGYEAAGDTMKIGAVTKSGVTIETTSGAGTQFVVSFDSTKISTSSQLTYDILDYATNTSASDEMKNVVSVRTSTTDKTVTISAKRQKRFYADLSIILKYNGNVVYKIRLAISELPYIVCVMNNSDNKSPNDNKTLITRQEFNSINANNLNSYIDNALTDYWAWNAGKFSGSVTSKYKASGSTIYPDATQVLSRRTSDVIVAPVIVKAKNTAAFGRLVYVVLRPNEVKPLMISGNSMNRKSLFLATTDSNRFYSFGTRNSSSDAEDNYDSVLEVSSSNFTGKLTLKAKKEVYEDIITKYFGNTGTNLELVTTNGD